MNTEPVPQVEEAGVRGEKDVDATFIGFVGFIGAVIVFAIIVLLQVIYFAWVSRVEAQHRNVLPDEVVNVRTEQQLRLKAASPDQRPEAGVLPIEAAMKLVVRDLAAGRSAGEVGGQMTPATGEPAPAAQPSQDGQGEG